MTNERLAKPEARALYPYEYEIAWRIFHYGPLAAADLTGAGRWRDTTPAVLGQKMAALVKRGVLRRDDEWRIYDLTDEMREAMTW